MISGRALITGTHQLLLDSYLAGYKAVRHLTRPLILPAGTTRGVFSIRTEKDDARVPLDERLPDRAQGRRPMPAAFFQGLSCCLEFDEWVILI